MHELYIENDFVAIIDFLPSADRKAMQVSQKLFQLLTAERIRAAYMPCETSAQFAASFNWLGARSKEGRIFIIHLIGHGTVNGLVMPHGAVVAWKNLSPLFLKLDPAVVRKCFLNLSCCRGINGIKLNDHLPASSTFFGVIGPSRDISPTEAIKMNAMFYRKMIQGRKINRIIDDINQRFTHQIIYGLTSAGYRRLKPPTG